MDGVRWIIEAEKKALLQLIADKRKEMIDIAMRKGFACTETVRCSQELDGLLNVYERRFVKLKMSG
ncbi:aspartyl-phosphate phosphatase Spo0E family protein [Bacillus taeanensis]|uniref:Aspartyl-phosphate phosphatase Spo0E family protein n=1 Tax=Bacillus taeanensis TaxID=273032 RepID=A0A366XRG0_9BACI|nr:aspartyl-phosphate phosphatase Spo0E family protein [Bacillus taeanensis]RBW68118.1 aspartyl-phosphate phosphatase Spo0E family protein [Bacillus taeanensis]